MQFDLPEVMNLKPLIQDYIRNDRKLLPFISAFPDTEAFRNALNHRKFTGESRSFLISALRRQYSGLKISPACSLNLDAMRDEDTFTVTTGHQLCLFTGPLYFISKIASAIRLAQILQQEFPEKKIVPVFWLASEDHDFEEISTANFPNHNLKWTQSQHGAVGRMNTEGITPVIDELTALGVNHEWIEMLRIAYRENTMVAATRILVNELFGEYGLVVIDGDDAELKSSFSQIMAEDCVSQSSFSAVSEADNALKSLDYDLQVHPREINLFYLGYNSRTRIVAKNEEQFELHDGSKFWNKKDLLEEITAFPENFSPNVILRPVYQETILPNVAYVGGPGELTYWLQLRAVFDVYNTPMPLLILRDHLCVLPDSIEHRLLKLGITLRDLYRDKKTLMKLILPMSDMQLEDEKLQLQKLFESIAAKATAIDPTLGPAALADGKRAESVISQIEGKMIRALKQKEETKIRQLEKLTGELFPDGEIQERHLNYFYFASQTNENLIDAMIREFDPMKNRMTVLLYRTESR